MGRVFLHSWRVGGGGGVEMDRKEGGGGQSGFHRWNAWVEILFPSNATVAQLVHLYNKILVIKHTTVSLPLVRLHYIPQTSTVPCYQR